jgi:RecT family
MNDETKPQEAAKPRLMPVVDTGEFAQLLDSDRFAQVQRVAKLFSESDLVPAIFQGKPANCAVALQMAFRMRIDPMTLMQNMYIIKGRPGIEAKLAIGLIDTRGPFKGPLQWRFEGEGDERACYCYAIHRATGEKCEVAVTWKMAVAEGWVNKDGSKWKTMPEVMFRYRSAMFLGRLYCPEVLLGLSSDDELRDSEITVDGTHVLRPAIVMPQAKAAAFQEAWNTAAGKPDAAREPVINAETGEILSPADPPLDNRALGDADLIRRPTPPQPAAVDVMSQPASEAQRKAILNTGTRKNLTPEQIGEIVLDATGFTLDTLPMGAVNPALGAIANHGKSAA